MIFGFAQTSIFMAGCRFFQRFCSGSFLKNHLICDTQQIRRINYVVEGPLEELEAITHQMNLKEKYLHQIKIGQKTIEGRIFSGKVLQMRPGDVVQFNSLQNTEDHVECHISAIEKYTSFEEMLSQCGYQNCLPDVNSLQEAINVYHQFPQYFERAKESGVAAIHFRLEKKP